MKAMRMVLVALALLLVGQVATARQQWVEYKADKYGFSMLVPKGTKLVAKSRKDGWGVLWAKQGQLVLHGVSKLGKPARVGQIENFGIRYTGIARKHWRVIDQGKHNGFHWYKTAYASNGKKALVAVYGTGPKGSYLLLMHSSVAHYKKNKAAFKHWYESIKVW